MVISDHLFEAFLKCKTKAYLLFFSEPVRSRCLDSVGKWQLKVREDACQTYIQSLVSRSADSCLIGAKTLNTKDIYGYQWIVRPELLVDDMMSTPPLLENSYFAPKGTRARSCICAPVRIFPFEKIDSVQKQLLAFDALVLGKATGHFSTSGKIIHGRQQAVSQVKLPSLISKAEVLIRELRSIVERNTPPSLSLIKHCQECEFESLCRDRAEKEDNISLLGMIPPAEIVKLRSKGIFTVTQLSYTFRPRRREAKSSRGKFVKYQYALKALAIRDKTTYIVGKPEIIQDGMLIYLDVEGIPDQGFYYLIGVRAVSGKSTIKRSFWANNKSEEGQIWRDFLDFMSSLENPVLLYYGSYETAFLKTMQTRYGDLPYERFSVSHITSQAVNVLGVIYSHFYFPTYTNGLKDIAGHLGFNWSTVNPSGLRSLMLRHKWELTNEERFKIELLSYNQDDCEALEVVVKAITAISPREDFSANTEQHPNAVQVESIENMSWPFSYGKKEFTFSEFAYITKCAYWDYQRNRVYVRTNKHINKIAKKSLASKTAQHVPINKVVSPTKLTQCPNCSSIRFFMNGRHQRTLYDLRFTSSGIKRWVTKKIVDHHKCMDCGITFVSDNAPVTKHRYGSQLFAYTIYNLIELHIAQFQLSKIVNKIFGLPLSQTTIGVMKRRAATLYSETFQKIQSDLLQGNLIHADETHVSVDGKDSYVWVFTSMEEVVYIWSETREASTGIDFLSDFKGVLISDFYTAYDSIDCPQQKCLIHLIRDLNDALLKEPFNQEMKELVREFAELVRKVIATVDRFGLKKYFLKKHLADVERFYDITVARKFETASTRKMQTRFKKNRNKLFTFLQYDGVPWNNNNAEHAVKAFGRGIRDVIGGRTNENGIADYLLLVSIYQTCEYRGIDFLDFLRSGEVKLDKYRNKTP
jgi:predicted RecB family nuclease